MEENTTDSTHSATMWENHEYRFQQLEWILCEGFNVLEVVFITWITLSLLVHGNKTGKWRKEKQSTDTRFNSGTVYSLAITATLGSLSRAITNQVAFNLGYADETPLPCEVAVDFAIGCYAVTLISTYVFLWHRQRSLYQHPKMEMLRKSWLEVLSYVTLFLIVIGGLFASLAMIIPDGAINSRYGCMRVPSDSAFFVWPFYVIITLVMISQAALLFLLLYPLFLHVTATNAERVMLIIKRSAVFAGVCVLSDTVAMIVVVFVVPADSVIHVALTVYDINMVVNVASVFFSFESWRTIILSPCRSCDRKQKTAFPRQFSNASLPIRMNTI